jgi:hypothetical protein
MTTAITTALIAHLAASLQPAELFILSRKAGSDVALELALVVAELDATVELDIIYNAS